MAIISSISNEHGRECDEAVNSFLKKLVSKNSESIFHYTSAGAFFEIIKSGSIWLTDARYLNDPSEVIHGVILARKLIEKIILSANSEVKEFLVPYLSLNLENIAQTVNRYFVASFSQKSDDLNQWRFYADNGKGISLEFSRDLIDYIVEIEQQNSEDDKTFPTPYSFPISYDNNIISEIYNTVLNITSRYLIPKLNDSSTKEKLAKNITSSIFLLSLYFKNDAYKDEQEYRLLMRCNINYDDGVKYRISNGGITPYREILWKNSTICPLRRIWIGPAAPSATTTDLVKEFLHHHGFGNEIEVVRSEKPYRAP